MCKSINKVACRGYGGDSGETAGGESTAVEMSNGRC